MEDGRTSNVVILTDPANPAIIYEYIHVYVSRCMIHKTEMQKAVTIKTKVIRGGGV